MKNKLAIFDLDGTLFDTNLVNYYSYKQALEENGTQMTVSYENFCKDWNGRSYKEFLPEILFDGMTYETIILQKLFNHIELIEKVHEDKIKLYETNLNKARQNDKLFDLIEHIKSSYNIALVTTANKKNTNQIIKTFNKEEIFDLIITREDVKNSKPNPEGFNKAIQYFGLKPEDTIIFEDSEVGITAARQSGATVFVVDKF